MVHDDLVDISKREGTSANISFKELDMGVRFFEDRNALDSLRSSDFDALSAYGEAIDNAIQAKAKNINIEFDAPVTNRNRPIKELAFGDDGIGMDADTLASCLKLGWSSRFNDRSGIGRFGVGMILGAIHECKRIEVYSKQETSSKWLWTYIDLDEIEDGKMETIPTPTEKNIPEKYLEIVGKDHGTLVLWSKYDRQKGSADKIIKEAHTYFGRTFRKFIWDGISIKIDKEDVKAHDPLYVTTDKTKFPNDPSAEEYEPFTFKWPISDPKVAKEFGEFGEITIRMSILPEEFRPRQGAGGSAEAKARHIDQMQEGISILREGREVFFGPIPYWSFVRLSENKQNSWSFQELDRWWGCEISFGAELDASFEVKNIKRGAKPEEELLKAIKQKITPTRNTVLEEVSEVWKKRKAREQRESDDQANVLGRHSSHKGAEKAAEQGLSPRSRFDADKSPEKVIDDHLDKFGATLEAQQKQRYKELFASQPYTIIDDHEGWRGGAFWEVTPGGNKIVMQYNLQHEFFKELRSLENMLAEENDEEQIKILSRRITGLVDLLLISVAKSQANYDAEMKYEVREFVEDFNQTWGRTLKNFVRSWTENNYGEDNE